VSLWQTEGCDSRLIDGLRGSGRIL
jgi:hypothetical protein